MPIYTQAYLRSYTPVVTLVGGAGNTVPVYSTNTGYSELNGNQCFYRIFLSGDGGAEGAGTGQLTISLDKQSSASEIGGKKIGFYSNGAITAQDLFGVIGASSSTISLNYQDTATTYATFTGDMQNNTSRYIIITGAYLI